MCTTCFTQSQDFVPDEQEAQQVAHAPATLDRGASRAQSLARNDTDLYRTGRSAFCFVSRCMMYLQSQGGHARAKLQRFHDGAGAAEGAAPPILMTGRCCNIMRRLARSRRFECAHSVACVRTRLVLPTAGAEDAALFLARCCDARAGRWLLLLQTQSCSWAGGIRLLLRRVC